MTRREPSVAWCVCKTAVQTVVIWSVALAVGPWLILMLAERLGLDGARFTPRVWIGAAIFAPAGVLGLVSGWTMAVRGRGTPLPMDPARRLVVAGPYRWVRNPMAIGGLAQGLGVGIALGSWWVIAYVATGMVVWNYGVRRWEERQLVERFGEEYEAYRREVRCWWPRVRPVAVGGEVER